MAFLVTYQTFKLFPIPLASSGSVVNACASVCPFTVNGRTEVTSLTILSVFPGRYRLSLLLL